MDKPVAVISGGSGYLGSAVRRALERDSWDVISLSRHTPDDSQTLACDVTNEQQVQEAIQNITERYGDISACIHAASPPVDNKPLLEVDGASFDMQLNVAVRGAFLLAKAAVPHMKVGSAFIGITTKLIEPEAALPPTGGYVAAKYGLRGFLRTLVSEPAAKHIRVYAIAPGFLPGGLNHGVSSVELDFLASKSGIGKTSVEEVADLVRTLCAEKDAYPPGSSISLPPTQVAKL